MNNQSEPKTNAPERDAGVESLPVEVAEELSLLRVVLAKLDALPARTRTPVDDAATLIELRDAVAEAKPEDQGPLLEQMHRVEALSRQRGKRRRPACRSPVALFRSPAPAQDGRRRDVLIGQRGFVEPGGGVQIVDWRNAPVSRLLLSLRRG